jgi:hypothetical protein
LAEKCRCQQHFADTGNCIKEIRAPCQAMTDYSALWFQRQLIVDAINVCDGAGDGKGLIDLVLIVENAAEPDNALSGVNIDVKMLDSVIVKQRRLDLNRHVDVTDLGANLRSSAAAYRFLSVVAASHQENPQSQQRYSEKQ